MKFANAFRAFYKKFIGVYGVKKYTALLTQSNTNAPVAAVLENTLGGTLVWTRVGTGDYRATLVGIFTSNKTIVIISNPVVNGIGGLESVNVDHSSVDYINVGTFNDTSYADDIMSSPKRFIEIKVYP